MVNQAGGGGGGGQPSFLQQQGAADAGAPLAGSTTTPDKMSLLAAGQSTGLTPGAMGALPPVRPCARS